MREPATTGDTVPTEKHRMRLPEQIGVTGGKTTVISGGFVADAEGDATIARIVEQLGGERVHVLVTLRPPARIMPSPQLPAPPPATTPRAARKSPPAVPDSANRSLTLAETEMLRNLDKEFRGNGLPDELYSQLIRNRAVMHMKNACSPAPHDVMRITGDPGLCPPYRATRPAALAEVAAQVLHGALVVTSGAR